QEPFSLRISKLATTLGFQSFSRHGRSHPSGRSASPLCQDLFPAPLGGSGHIVHIKRHLPPSASVFLPGLQIPRSSGDRPTAFLRRQNELVPTPVECHGTLDSNGNNRHSQPRIVFCEEVPQPVLEYRAGRRTKPIRPTCHCTRQQNRRAHCLRPFAV